MEKADLIEAISTLGYSPSSSTQLYNTVEGFRKTHYPNRTLDELLQTDISRLRKVATIPNTNTKRNVAKAFLVLKQVLNMPRYTENLAYYRKVFSKANTARELAGEGREPIDETNTQKTIEDLEKRFQSYKNDNDISMMTRCLPTYILGRILTSLPTRRAMDYRILQMKKPSKNPNENNYYSKGNMYFNKFKGSNHKQGVCLEVPDDIRNLFNFLRKLDRKRQFLIERPDRGEYSVSMFSKFVKNTFGLNMNHLRKLCVQKNIDQTAIDQATQLADNMSHSISTQQTDYA